MRVKELEARQRDMEGRLKELQDAVTADGEKLRNQVSGYHTWRRLIRLKCLDQ